MNQNGKDGDHPATESYQRLPGFGTTSDQLKLTEANPDSNMLSNLSPMSANSNNIHDRHISSKGENSLFTKKVNFKHGNRLQTDVQNAELGANLGFQGSTSNTSFVPKNTASYQRTQTDNSKVTSSDNTRQTAMTVETIDVQIDRQALQNRDGNGGQQNLQRLIQSRKAAQKYRDAHQTCQTSIESDNDIALLGYLQGN